MEAESLYRKALEIRESLLDPKDPRVKNTLKNLAVLLHNTNREKESRVFMRRFLDID
jgi:hypothetical protein